MSQYHYSNHSTSFLSSGVGIAEEIRTCLCGSVGSKPLYSIQSFKNQTGPRSIKRNLFVVRAMRLSWLLSPGPIQAWGRQSQPKLTNFPKQKQTGERMGIEMLSHDLVSEYTSCSLGEGCPSFFSLFPLLSNNFPPSEINVDAITFHNQSRLQALFQGCWCKNSGIALPHPPHRESWNLSCTIHCQACQHKPTSLRDFCSFTVWGKLRKSRVFQFRVGLTQNLSIFGVNCLETSCFKHAGTLMDTTGEAAGSFIKAVTTRRLSHS